jgi:ABC-type uncharacterized transport system involved in gliding motility auxiliary subunit
MSELQNPKSEAAKVRESIWVDPGAFFGGISRRRMAWIGLALGAVILLSVNMVASIGLRNVKSDLTADRLFTISDGTREVLASIDEPMTTRLYFSRRLA